VNPRADLQRVQAELISRQYPAGQSAIPGAQAPPAPSAAALTAYILSRALPRPG
jgi:hypothetical protein